MWAMQYYVLLSLGDELFSPVLEDIVVPRAIPVYMTATYTAGPDDASSAFSQEKKSASGACCCGGRSRKAGDAVYRGRLQLVAPCHEACVDCSEIDGSGRLRELAP